MDLAQLSDPSQERGNTMLKSLDGLYNQLSAYMEDYITKATAIYSPRAYLALPGLSPKRSEPQFRNKSIGLKLLKLVDLSDLERKRLLRAFLRYELICKVYHPRQGTPAELDTIDQQSIRANFRLQGGEYEAIKCVYGYVGDLYGAVFAHHADAWLPSIPKVPCTKSSNTVSRSDLLFPDNVLLFLKFITKTWI